MIPNYWLIVDGLLAVQILQCAPPSYKLVYKHQETQLYRYIYRICHKP